MTELYDSQGRISLTAMKALLRSVVHEELAPHVERLDQFEECQSDLHRAIGGNGYGMSEGLVGIVKDLLDRMKKMEKQERVQAVEKRIDRFKWVLTGLAVGSGALAASIVTAITQAIGAGP